MDVELAEVLEFSPDAPPAILAGAGISLSAPSNLLGGYAFMEAILSRVMPPEVDRTTAQSLISPPRGGKYRIGEYIRFETLMGELVRSGLDADLHVLDCLDACEQPNEAHFVLAALIRRGAVVITTNFDRLIEIAYKLSASQGEPPLRIAFADEDFPAAGPPSDGIPTLWKIHGSLSVEGESTRNSLQATVNSIVAPVRNQNRQKFLDAVLRRHDLLILGYSGGDDLDIVPVLSDAAPENRLWWINHSPAAVHVVSAASYAKTVAVPTPLETVGRDRVLLERGLSELEGGISKTLRIDANTGAVIKHLADTYCSATAFAIPSTENLFGQKYPVEVEQYFDHWSASFDTSSSAAYQLAANLYQLRSFRPSEGHLYRKLESRRLAIVQRLGATPSERLDALASQFNASQHPDPPTPESDRANTALLAEIERVFPSLPARDISLGHRLAASTLWNLRRTEEAETRYRMAIDSSRAIGDLDGELFTLTTWQKSTNSVSDHLSFEDHKLANHVASVLGRPGFPDDAFLRLQELAAQTGHQLHMLAHIIAGLHVGYAEDNGERRRLLHGQLMRAARVAIDVGDVIGEGTARFYTGVSFFDVGQYDDAVIELVAVLELCKVAPLGDLQERANHLIEAMNQTEIARKLAPVFRQALWLR